MTPPYQVDQKVLTGRTQLSVPGYDPKEKFEFGVITSFAYPLEGSDEKIVIATTRPETLLGDTAIAVHPDDERYKVGCAETAVFVVLGLPRRNHGADMSGFFFDNPTAPARQVRAAPVPRPPPADHHRRDRGRHVVRNRCGQDDPGPRPERLRSGMRHKLDFINILNDDGTLNANAGPEFEGMKRFHARRKVVDEMKKKGLYVGDAENPMSIPVCAKSGDFIESVMKPQWWVSQKSLAEKAIEVRSPPP
jgi:valyl-tRNA synthetase